MKYPYYKFGIAVLTLTNHDITVISSISRNLKPIGVPYFLTNSSVTSEVITCVPGIVGFNVKTSLKSYYDTDSYLFNKLKSTILIVTSEKNYDYNLKDIITLPNSYNDDIFIPCISRAREDFPIVMTAEHIHALAFHKSNTNV